jgi:hypothetical protein
VLSILNHLISSKYKIKIKPVTLLQTLLITKNEFLTS